MDPPEVVVCELRRGRRLERRDPAALRVQAREDGPDDTVLARRVESLENDQQTARPLGVEPLLQPFETLVQRLEQLVPLILVEPEHVTWIAVLDSCGRSWPHAQRLRAVGELGHGPEGTPRMLSDPVSTLIPWSKSSRHASTSWSSTSISGSQTSGEKPERSRNGISTSWRPSCGLPMGRVTATR